MSTRKLNIAIVWANPYNKNLGVGALAYSALALLDDVVKESGLEAEFSFFGSSTNTSDVINIGCKNIPFNNFYGFDLYHWKGLVKLNFFPKKFQTKLLKEFDYVFDIAEGDSFTDIYGAERFWRILNSKLFFSKFRKPQVLLPQTIGPFKDPKHEKAAFEAMQHIDLVISRDKQSFDYSAKFLPGKKIAETIDVAFYMPFERLEFDSDKVQVGINISGLLWNGGYTKNNQFGMKTDYKKLMRDVLSFFTEQENIQVHLVPHVIPAEDAVEDDYALSEALQKEFPGTLLAPRFNTPVEAKSYISGMDFFTGARMHACIAAFSTGVAVYPLAYSRKFNGLFGETLQYANMGDCVNETNPTVLEGLRLAFSDREKLQQEIHLAHENIILPRLTLLKKLLSETLKK